MSELPGEALRSRYRPGGSTDYDHRLHAGNVGDAWKHCGLIEAIERTRAPGASLAWVESHAGAGIHPLGPTGEWTEGIARLAAAVDAGSAASSDVPGAGLPARLVALCGRLGFAGSGSRVPGSPALAAALLGEGDSLHLHEIETATCRALADLFAQDPRVVVSCGDGLAPLGAACASAEARGARVVALIDPPWSAKSDWTTVPDALARAVADTESTCFLLWYPVKSLTRPNAMLARLASAGVRATVAELVTTPLDERRRRLNGSGLIAVRPPAGWRESIAAAAPVVGAACATRGGAWSFRMIESPAVP